MCFTGNSVLCMLSHCHEAMLSTFTQQVSDGPRPRWSWTLSKQDTMSLPLGHPRILPVSTAPEIVSEIGIRPSSVFKTIKNVGTISNYNDVRDASGGKKLNNWFCKIIVLQSRTCVFVWLEPHSASPGTFVVVFMRSVHHFGFVQSEGRYWGRNNCIVAVAIHNMGASVTIRGYP